MNNEIAILIVDDVELIRDSMKQILNELGYFNVFYASNEITAHEVYRNKKIHFVFMDINLGESSGLEVIVELKKYDSNLYAVILSGESNIQNVRKSISLGAKGFIVKPFTRAKIKEVMQAYEK
ncbi:MAG: response regulator [Saccharospirillaceae bacterium]|nr:response regulator [Pseudomonadales bacterium]NRB80677.1 response regulator [Saccharospirillaceae bacterium]